MIKEDKYEKPTSWDVFQWPEFKDFAQRLMIDLGAPTTRLVIDLDIQEPVKITHETLGLDSEAPVKPQKSELTM